MRDVDSTHLHPAFRARDADLEARIQAEGLPLRPYEGARTPFRQAELYAFGRVEGVGISGHHKTDALAWRSHHQFACARDRVFFVNGLWTWDEPEKGMWQRYTALCTAVGLRTLSFERPHAELPVAIADLQAGRYPPGDSTWANWLEDQIELWGRDPRVISGLRHPGAPPHPSAGARPSLAA